MYEEMIESLNSESIMDLNVYPTSLFPDVIVKELYENTVRMYL